MAEAEVAPSAPGEKPCAAAADYRGEAPGPLLFHWHPALAAKRPPSRKKAAGGGGRGPARFVLYPLALIGGLYVGAQAYALARGAPLELSGPRLPLDWLPGAAQASQKPKPSSERPRPRAQHAERSSPNRLAPVRGAPRSRLDASPPTPNAQRSTLPDSTPAEVTIRPADAVPADEIARGPGHRPEVALTFDAGADWKPVRPILEALEDAGAQCTFFVTGKWVEANPRSSRAIADGGHELGNHSWDHAAFTGLSDEAIRDQLRRTEEIVQETTHRSTLPYFRPPLGARDRRVRQLAAEEGYRTVYWSLDSRDAVDRGITPAQIRDRVLSRVETGSIVLLHCGSQATADALPEILEGLRGRGLRPVTITQLLKSD
jgi:peptidoglycan/xylan/chitin deacetylase (PgdA/CDA1 family)